ncbi:hypothetical protein PJ985_14135 [Streptomyces sp. ACA25]|uniref:HAAS signaling domain-containing protein n=1 Tax=Streptomyces sp. ACA25 TaxID=3022596 RepID=UPI0023075FBA|nr:hypothetical protein [Streptomyces sp. ACA25]MDB1088708.1 hypothetical protein [Streptomyces sp. ACA25]
MSTTRLTELYVDEVVRRLPADQCDDIAAELRATIADTVEGRDASDPRAAEREVLSEMGDPIRYAARYRGRPPVLIGPDLYPAYIRLLAVLLGTVLPLLSLVLVALDFSDTGDPVAAVRNGAVTGLMVGVQVFVVLTVAFAAAERVRHRDGTTTCIRSWTPDDLPRARQAPDKAGFMTWATVGWDLLLLTLILWQYTAKPYRADGAEGEGERIAVLDPALWSGWIWPVLLGLAGLVVVSLARLAARGWTMRLALLYATAQAVFALSLAWLLHQQMFFNPAFLADVSQVHGSPEQLYNGVALIVLAMAASGAVSSFRSAR